MTNTEASEPHVSNPADELERLRAELAEAREEVAFFRREVSFQAERLMPEIHSLTEQLTAAQQRVERLKDIAERLADIYASHTVRCATQHWQKPKECDCGLSEIDSELAALTESEGTDG